MGASLMNSIISLDDIYPVGSIYMNINSTNPTNLFGGVWEQIKERFILGCCDTHKAGATGEVGKWSFKRIDYIYHHIKNPIPVVTHYKTNVVGTAFTISEYDNAGFTVWVYDIPKGYRAFTWVAIKPE